MIDVTITIPLASIPGVEVDVREHEAYHDSTLDKPSLDKLALEFRGEASVDFPDWDNPYVPQEEQWDRITVADGWHRLKKPRLVVMP